MHPVDRRDVAIVEVAPRDGLQNYDRALSTNQKIAFIEALVDAGVRTIEAASFVNPAAVPLMADAAEVMTGIRRVPGVRYLALTPNLRGLERAMDAGVDAIAIFAAATEAFSRANLNASIDEAFGRFQDVVDVAKRSSIWVRGYISVGFHCPYSGKVPVAAVLPIIERLLQLDCDEIAIADTTGMAEPADVHHLVSTAREAVPVDRLALHFHDTRGLAIENIQSGFELGVSVFDSSAGGIGGCPFSPNAPGNVATEVVIEHFENKGIKTGVDATNVRDAYLKHVHGADGART